jgi:Domain of unknown function (DUF4386)
MGVQMLSSIERSPQFYARIAGAMYFAIVLLGAFGELVVRGSWVIAGDATATANAIASSLSLWRWGIAGDLLMHVLDIPVIVVMYVLLRRVNKDLALFATAINLIQTAVLAANKLNLVVPILLMDNAIAMKSFSPEQLHALAYAAIQAHSYGFGIGLIFFGVACVARGWLIFHSGFLPKFLGVLLAIAGLCYLINSFALLLAPSIASLLFPAILLPPLIAESLLALWMMVKGVDLEHWRRA